MDKKELGKILKSEREKRNLSISDLSRKTGIARTTLISYEEGKVEASFFKILKIAKELDLDLNLFLRQETDSSMEKRVSSLEKNVNKLLAG